MMPSGHITAQFAHPMQSSLIISKKLYPFLFTFFDKEIQLFGQPVIQTPHPLQCSVSINRVPLNAIVTMFNVNNDNVFFLIITIYFVGTKIVKFSLHNLFIRFEFIALNKIYFFAFYLKFNIYEKINFYFRISFIVCIFKCTKW